MKISGPYLSTRQNGETSLSAKIESEHLGNQELWFSTIKKYAMLLCKDRLDAFLVGLIYPAMYYGEDIHLDGCVSKQLLLNMNHYTIPLLLSFSPACNPVKITAREVSSQNLSTNGIGTGFSAGVDSFCTIYDWFVQEEDPEYKINHLLFLNVGSHGPGKNAIKLEATRKKFLVRYENLKVFADEIGLDFIPLDSNLHQFHPWGHQKTHTLTSVSGILVFQSLFSRYYYASSGINYDLFFEYAKDYRDVDTGAYSDPILLPLLSTESTQLLSDGIQFVRPEKLQRILEYEPVQRYLNVCVNEKTQWENCSVCPKCCRTLMVLESLGKLDLFRDLFDIEKYKKKARRRYMSLQLAKMKRDPFAHDNVTLAKQNGLRFPNIFHQYYFRTIDILRRLAKKILPASLRRRIRSR